MYLRKDGYYRLAKQQGYRSRAAFKLIELNESYQIIHPHDTVLDIGAAPGGWMQVIKDVVRQGGTAVGVDILDIAPLPGQAHSAVTLKGDVNDARIRQRALAAIRGKFDVVVSDLSVNISGNALSDTSRNLAMVRSILSYLPELLREGGNFLIKLFYSDTLKSIRADAEGTFEKVFTTKPKASRSSSSELYLIGKGFRPAAGDKKGVPHAR